MDPVARFAQYAEAFEEVVADDDWTRLEPFFTEDAVYEILAGPPFGGRHEGREAVFAALKASLDTFDRRFRSRDLEILDGPSLIDGRVRIRWRVTYALDEAPNLVLEGEELCELERDRIRRLTDRFEEHSLEGTVAWMSEHGAKLGLT